jgi:hypothetical protein
MAGFTRPDYEALLAQRAESQRFVVVTTERLLLDKERRRVDSLARLSDKAEKERLRKERAEGYARESRLELAMDKLASRPFEKPFLLNPNTYKGALGGILLTLAGLVYLHR